MLYMYMYLCSHVVSHMHVLVYHVHVYTMYMYTPCTCTVCMCLYVIVPCTINKGEGGIGNGSRICVICVLLYYCTSAASQVQSHRQSMLSPTEVHSTCVQFNVTHTFVLRVLEIMICVPHTWWSVSMYNCNFCCELVLILSKVPSAKRKSSASHWIRLMVPRLPIGEMIKFSDIYGWCHVWIWGKSVTKITELWDMTWDGTSFIFDTTTGLGWCQVHCSLKALSPLHVVYHPTTHGLAWVSYRRCLWYVWLPCYEFSVAERVPRLEQCLN